MRTCKSNEISAGDETDAEANVYVVRSGDGEARQRYPYSVKDTLKGVSRRANRLEF